MSDTVEAMLRITPPPVGSIPPDRFARAQVDAEDVDPVQPVHVVGRRQLDVSDMSNPGIVDEDIDALVRAVKRAEERSDGVGLRDVARVHLAARAPARVMSATTALGVGEGRDRLGRAVAPRLAEEPRDEPAPMPERARSPPRPFLEIEHGNRPGSFSQTSGEVKGFKSTLPLKLPAFRVRQRPGGARRDAAVDQQRLSRDTRSRRRPERAIAPLEVLRRAGALERNPDRSGSRPQARSS